MEVKKVLLNELDMPKYWYNVLPDLPNIIDPPLHPVTGKPLKPQDLERLFAKELIEQELSNKSEIEIPEEIREVYAIYRPTPLVRAHNLEKALKTPASIYYKNESVSPAGSHKPNTAIAQAYYNKKRRYFIFNYRNGCWSVGKRTGFCR
jgi:tryptophan synthase beta chain